MRGLVVVVLAFATLVGTTLPALGAVTVGASLDRSRAAVGDQVTLSLSISGDIGGLQEPRLSDMGPFDVYSRGHSQRVSWNNNQRSSSHTFNYTLIPKEPGKFTLPAITVVVDGNTYQSVPVELEVTPAGSRPATPPPSAKPPVGAGGDDYFVTMTVDKDEVVVGEQIILSFAFYRATRSSLFDSPEYTPPATEGFLREDLPPERRYDRVVRSRRYAVTEIRYALFPTRAGELTVGEAVVRIPDDMFSSFLNRRRGRRRGDVFLRAPEIQVSVKPVPRGAPAGFEGTVGQGLEFTATVDRTELPVGDALTLTVGLAGDGYLAAAKQPTLPDLEGFRIHDAGSSLDSRPLGGRLNGSLEVHKLLIPTQEGEAVIPGLSYVYYDTGESRFVTLTTPPMNIQVLPSDAPASAVFAGAGRSEIELLSQDILHLKPVVGGLRPAAGPFPSTLGFWGVLALPGLAWAASGLLARRRRNYLSDPARIRRARALKEARAILAGDGAVADRASLAIHSYVAAKSDREAAGLTASFIQSWLERSGGPEELGQRVLGILQRCDEMRFAPGSGDDAKLVQQTEQALTDLEASQ